MAIRGWKVRAFGVAGLAAWIGGCASIDDHQRVKAQNRSLAAQKEALAQELFDCRTANDRLKTRTTALERELETKNELVANLRSENEILDDMRKMALSELEKAAGMNALGDITIAGPKLPEQLDSAIKQFASQHPSLVEYDAARGVIKWKADLLFPLGSDVVKESSMEALRAFADVIKSPVASEFEALVVGHTDNRPIVRPETKQRHPTNWDLSAHRAISVAQILQRFDYPPAKIGVMGYGEYRPIASNATEQGAAQNRRVEIYLVPRGSIVQASASAGSSRRDAAMSSAQP